MGKVTGRNVLGTAIRTDAYPAGPPRRFPPRVAGGRGRQTTIRNIGGVGGGGGWDPFPASPEGDSVLRAWLSETEGGGEGVNCTVYSLYQVRVQL